MEQKKMEQKITEVVRQLDIRRLELFKFLYFLATKRQTKTKDLIRKTGQPEKQIRRLLRFFADYLEPPTQKVVVKKSERKEIEDYSRKMIKQIVFGNSALVKKVLTKYKKSRPVPDRKYDQFTSTIITTAKRGLKMARNGDFWQRNVAVLGDDDLTSVAIALSGQVKKVTVFEVDDRIVNLINKICQQEKLSIEVIKHDLRCPLPKKYLNCFDTVFTDPPYTNSGISLFLNRAIELIKDNYGSRIYLCYGNSDRAREREVIIQEVINEKGLLINSKKYQFNKYLGAESIGSSSSLYLLDWTPKTKITKVDFENKFYTNE